MLVYSDTGWGAPMVLRNLLPLLNKEKYRVVAGIITPDPSQPLRAPVPDGVDAVRLALPKDNFFHSAKFFLRLSQALKEYRIHLLHINGGPVRSLLAAAWQCVPIVIAHRHGSYGLEKWKTRMKGRLLGRFIDLNIAVSHTTKDYVIEKLGYPPDCIKVIHNGIGAAAFQSGKSKEAMRRELGVPLEVPVMGIVARLAHWGKGHRELFAAMAALKPPHMPHALVVGGGVRRPEMEKLVQELGLAQQVHFLGTRFDIPDLLAAMDIFALPGSHGEGISLSILEAMAAGLPIIASRVGGTPELIRHEETGLLVPVGDSQALAECLSRLLEAPAWARQLGDAARKEACGHFSLDRVGREIEETYEALIREKLNLNG
jgi:glycosyltransferase involved in cell wall biosynthesis